MKHIKTFEQFVNESSVDEIASRFKPRKPDWPFFFQIFAREADKDGDREKHKVTVGKKDDFREIEKQVLKDYPHNKYYYTLWKNVRGGFKNVGTNESEELTEEFLNELIEESKITSYIIKNGFTFETVDGKKFTLPRGAEIEAEKITSPRTRNGLQSISFKVVKGKLDGHAADKNKTYEVDIHDFNDYINDNDIELNESVNESYMDNYHNYYIAKHDIEYGSPMWVKKTQHVPKGTIMLAIGGGMFESIDKKYILPNEVSSVNGVATKGYYDIRKDKDNYEEVNNTVWQTAIEITELIEEFARDDKDIIIASKQGDIKEIKAIIKDQMAVLNSIKKLIK